jgi:hypothetical protein
MCRYMELTEISDLHSIYNNSIFLVFVNDALRAIQDLYRAAGSSDDVAGTMPIYALKL